MATEHYEARFGGAGGQGLMLIGDILAFAAGCLDNKEILLTKSYGPESRGGACRSELIIDARPINYPAVSKPDFVLAMTQLACEKYHADIADDGVLLIDSDLVTSFPDRVKTVYGIPLTKIATETIKNAITANITALGAIAVLARCAETASIKQAILNRFPENLHSVNVRAFEAGVTAAQSAKNLVRHP
ncbi:2-oxoglutarate ferredoxin oxidoreductase subunit gamma [Deltaproteobacteria bacterium]|nr:2-oxoglutarate ferredoxin oxidoreductase subunit gamma [Deltaproteobacteria bacterium]